MKWKELRRGRLTIKYIFYEMLPIFLIGVALFVGVLLMFQSFRLAEYVIIHGAKLSSILKILFYLGISFLPIIFPMSLLFAVLITYGRLSNDSEIVAFKSIGLNIFHIMLPALVLAMGAAFFSLQTSFQLSPWGNRQMEVLVHRIGESKPGITLKEGVFSEGYFDMVVYANKVDSKSNQLYKVFIYDERNEESPMTIVAKSGLLVSDQNSHGQKAFLRLFDGNIHKTTDTFYTKVDFKSYDVVLHDPIQFTKKTKSPLSYTYDEIKQKLKSKDTPDKLRTSLEIEFQKRFAISFLCIVFAFLGVVLGTKTNRRTGKSSGLVMSIIIVVSYWILHITFESLAKNNIIPTSIALWIPLSIYLTYGMYLFKKEQLT